MELGQKVVCRPVALVEYELNGSRSANVVRTGKVCYIHPKGRYITAEFEMPGGHILKESFQPQEVQVAGRKRK